MLQLVNEGNVKKWLVTADKLRREGIRSPQGFTFAFGYEEHFFWTTDEFNAYLFYKKYGSNDPAVHADFQLLKEKEEYLYNLSSSTTCKINFKSPDGCIYREHQKAGIEYCLNVNNVLIADDMRIGKTPMSLGVINNTSNVNKILIICPKTAKPGWLTECKKWLMKPFKIQVLAAQSDIDQTANIYISNYDNLHIHTNLNKIHWDFIIADEVHLIKNEDARRTRYFFKLHGKKKLGLSGTPLLNKPKDLLVVLQWLDSYWDKYSVYKGKFAAKNGISLTLEEVQDIIRSTLMLRRTQSQVFKAEPPEKRIVSIGVTDKLRPLLLKERHKLQDYTEARRLLGIYKVPYALNHINTYSSEGEKLVVFTWHKDVINRLASVLGNKAVTVFGDSTDAQRDAARIRFDTDPKCTVFIGSIAAASMALNLSVSHHIVFVECDWSAGLMDQAAERCSDDLQKHQVLIDYLVYDESLDYYILNKVDFKTGVADSAINI